MKMRIINIIVFFLLNLLLMPVAISQRIGTETPVPNTQVPMDPNHPEDPIGPGGPGGPRPHLTLYLDKDCDGFGSTLIGDFLPRECTTTVPGDCDDNNDQVTLGKIYFRDVDGDGFGNPNTGKIFCSKPNGYVLNGDDCNDSNADVHLRYWYRDKDGDSYGDPNDKVASCTKVEGYVFNSKDCNDKNYNLPQNWFYDQNGDGYLSQGEYQDPVLRDNITIFYSCTVIQTPIPSNQPMPPDTCTEVPPGWTQELYKLFKDFGFNSKEISNVYYFNKQTVEWYYANIDFLDPSKYGGYIEYEGLDGDIPRVILTCTSPGQNYIAYSEAKEDTKLHWIHSTSYDIKGNLIGATRSYFDDLGKPNVSLYKDFVQNRIWGTETSYDNFGRPDKSSFIAPSNLYTLKKVSFLNPDYVTSTNNPNIPIDKTVGAITSSQTIEVSNTLTATGAIRPGLNVTFTGNTVVLGNGFSVNSAAGGVFTATAKPSASNQSSDNAPFFSYYSDSNTVEPFQATATDPFAKTNYDTLNPGNVINVVGGNKIDGEWKTGYSYTVPAAQEMYYVYGSDYYDGPIVNGKEEVITKFYKTVSVDANGVENVAFTDGEGKVLASARSGSSTSYPVVSLIGTQGFVDVHIPAGITSGISLIGGASLYKIYDLKTGSLVSSLVGGNAYRIQAVTTPTADPKTYIAAGVPTYDSGALGIVYAVNYYDYAVNIYNKTGQLTKSVQPNGYVGSTKIVGAPTHMTSNNFATAYQYNNLGQLIEVSSPDEGISKFVYRTDGQIRYSQSALQKDTKISYTDYDSYARPIESGVITTTWAAATADPDGGLVTGSRSEQTFTIYDDADTNMTTVAIPSNLSLTNVLATAGISTTNYTQNNLSGNVAVTYKADVANAITAITWYSYDIYGRSEWMVQYNEGLGAKTIHYEYDYKGNVKKVLYQKDTASDLFVHQYTYDANNVLTKVQTSTDNNTFPVDAEYSYYLTGEVKRVNIAQGAQGLDYVYTLGGALKSINHPSLEASKDPGGDSNDVFGVTLDYYKDDYQRTGRNITASPTAGNDYNGNIKAVRWKNKGADPNGTNPKAYLYNYDRDNWITSATYGDADATTAAISPNAKYKEAGLSYDANGNIKTLQRSNDSGIVTDNLVYNYAQNKNQLEYVDENAAATTDKTDIEDQNAGNYTYDIIGQLTRNNLEDLTYFYNTQGLVTEVQKGGHAVIKMYYNERGQRVKKESYNTGTFALISTDYYSLDLSGNAMAIYNKPAGGAIVVKENPIFGLSRLGVYYRGGVKNYQIADHLGNVRAVIKKETVSGLATILSYADYYPFGEQLPGRNSQAEYRYAFQGQELDKETGMEAFQLRLWDGRLGRWLSPDPYGQYSSPYLGMGNNPVSMIDPDGGLAGGPGDPPQSWLGRMFSSIGSAFSGNSEVTYNEGQLKEVVIQGRGTSNSHIIYSKGINVDYGALGSTTNGGLALPQSFGSWNSTGSDGRQWIGCMACHGSNGAYSTLASNSPSKIWGEYFGSLATAGLMLTAEAGFDAVGAYKNAISPFKGGKLTNAGRAVTKHPEYFGFESTEALMKVHRTPAAINNLGSSTLKSIIRSGVKTSGAGGRYPNGWTTFTLPNGNAASWGADGTFIGFRGM